MNIWMKFFIAMVLCLSMQARAAEDPIGVVITVTGKVFANSEQNDSRVLARGDSFYVDDTISTEKDSNASLRFKDGSVIQVMGESEFKVHEYEYSPENPDKDAFSSELVKGGFRTISGKLGERSPDKVRMHTKTTTLTIRGTRGDIAYTTGFAGCNVGGAGVDQQMRNCSVSGGGKSIKGPSIDSHEGDATLVDWHEGEFIAGEATDENYYGEITDGVAITQETQGAILTEDSVTVYADGVPAEVFADALGGEENYLPYDASQINAIQNYETAASTAETPTEGSTQLEGQGTPGPGSDPCGGLQSIN